MSCQKTQVISLYRRLLRLHRQKLPSHMRQMGDTYVKKEFRDHQEAKAEFIGPFIREWTKYADSLEHQASQGSQFGRDLDEETISKLSEEQRMQIQRLRQDAGPFRGE
mmetsp:Transcript_10861/g.13593  ORF Transcript_10861/g.13593 Transcript_10861/m.13593 type:complete len:108 (-) Transcript_10861:457-780(-)